MTTQRLGLWTLFRYFRGGGIYRYDPLPRLRAARVAWAYWRKGSRVQVDD